MSMLKTLLGDDEKKLMSSPEVQVYAELVGKMMDDKSTDLDTTMRNLRSSAEFEAVRELFDKHSIDIDKMFIALQKSARTVELGVVNDKVRLISDCNLPPEVARKVATEICDLADIVDGSDKKSMVIGITKDGNIEMRFKTPTMRFDLVSEEIDELIESFQQAKLALASTKVKH